jgi:hypothetical protein
MVQPTCAAILLPTTYFAMASAGRLKCLQDVRQQQRLGILLHTAVTPGRTQWMWLLVFNSSDTAQRLKKGMTGTWATAHQAPT